MGEPIRYKTFTFPDVGEGIAEGEIVAWLVKQGDLIKEDQAVIEVETDKAVVSLPSPYSGKVVSLKGEPGQIIEVGTELFTIALMDQIEGKKKMPAQLSEFYRNLRRSLCFLFVWGLSKRRHLKKNHINPFAPFPLFVHAQKPWGLIWTP